MCAHILSQCYLLYAREPQVGDTIWKLADIAAAGCRHRYHASTALAAAAGEEESGPYSRSFLFHVSSNFARRHAEVSNESPYKGGAGLIANPFGNFGNLELGVFQELH